MKKTAIIFLLCFLLSACQSTPSQTTDEPIKTSGYDLSFSASDLEIGYDEDAQVIELSKDLEITDPGTYILQGEMTGQIKINVSESVSVRLVLDNVVIHASNQPAVYILSADKVFLTLSENSVNVLSENGEFIQSDDNHPDGVIFSKSDLTINGEGTLKIETASGHGIVSKDDLIIGSGTYEITASGQALNGKDCVKINSGTFILNSGKDAIQSDNSEYAERGFVYINNGNFQIVSNQDGIQAEHYLQIDAGNFSIETIQKDEESAKAIKSDGDLLIQQGNYKITSDDDALHSNGNLWIEDGNFMITSKDDGMHADASLTISNGEITITQSYEGLEGQHVLISDGNISITSSDDGINATDSNTTNSRMEVVEDDSIIINGGSLVVNAEGDGLDSNGTLEINGGDIVIYGPQNGGNGALDTASSAIISSGNLFATGYSQMAVALTTQNEACAILYALNTTYPANTSVKVSNGSEVLAEYDIPKSFNCLNLSMTSFKVNDTIMLTVGNDTYEINLSESTYSNVNGMNMPQRGPQGNQGGGFQEKPQGERPMGQKPEGDLKQPDMKSVPTE